ncbi:MAG: hypothetical protein ACYSSP_13040 [Planctomycetota bacterium]|jgi:hypothetical protein
MGKNKNRASRPHLIQPAHKNPFRNGNYPKKSIKSSPNPNHFEKITERRLQMPKVYRANYNQAMTGRSRRAAIKAFCLECVQWQKEEVRLCSSPQCSLYPYRPYRSSKKASESASFAQECEQG